MPFAVNLLPLPQPLAATAGISIPIVLPFPECCVSGIAPYVEFCIFSYILCDAVEVHPCGRAEQQLLGMLGCIPPYGRPAGFLKTHFPGEGHLDCFQFGPF